MTRSAPLLFLFFWASCANEQGKQEEKLEVTSRPSDTVAKPAADSLHIPVVEGKMTDRFLRLMKFADSSDFICDTARYKRTYQPARLAPYDRIYPPKIFSTGKYFYYGIPYRGTMLYNIVDHCAGAKRTEEDCKWEVKEELFSNVESILFYYYKAKTTVDNTTEDGIIEEWNFPDTASAMAFAKDLGKKRQEIYINRGAYICVIDDCVYIFHSRAAGFYTQLKKFFNHLVKANDAFVPE